MPLNSVGTFVKGALDGMTFVQPAGFPRAIPNAQAWIAPPIIGDMTTPQIYVWDGKITQSRKTMSGTNAPAINTTGAMRNVEYSMGMFIKYAMPNDDVLEDNIFPIIVDNVMEVLRGVVYPVQIVDANTGWPSTITDFGEEMEVWYGNIHSAEDGRFWVYEAEIRMRVRETIQQ